jgi:hypothetical protein
VRLLTLVTGVTLFFAHGFAGAQRFPAPDRPVARIIAPAYSDERRAAYLERLRARLAREKVAGVTLVRGGPRDPKLPRAGVDLALLSHVYHELENPFEFVYRLHPALAPRARVAIIDNDKPTRDHGTPPALLRCELAAVGYREGDFVWLAPADGYLAVFTPPATLPAVEAIRPCRHG